MNKIFITLCLSIFMISCAQKEIGIKSPSEKLEVSFSTNESGISLNLFESKNEILHIAIARFIFEGDTLFEAFTISNIKETSKNETWNPVYGERNVVKNHYNELEMTLTSKKNSQKSLQLICRVYDEGIAFKYSFNKNQDLLLLKELTSFGFNDDYDTWITALSQGEYRKGKISSIKEVVERPLVVKKNDTSYVAIGEAALVDFARMKLSKDSKKDFTLNTNLEGAVDLKKAGYSSPWRFVMVGDSPGELLENNDFVQNLNEPNKIENTSWIKPGKIIREISLTTKGAVATIDFADRHHIEYVEFDAGWYGYEYEDGSDATTVTVDPKRSPGPLDLQFVIDYAKEKGIGIILYVNRRSLEKQLDDILPLFKSWGIKGVKYGFVNVGPQKWTKWLHDAVRKAAKYELMVDIHDDYRPTGYSRTYPNLMTQEGIRGDEESPSTEHTLMTLFTRMLVGAGDNTNCYNATRVSETMGGKSAQMAKSIMLYSPWQFIYWYDRPAEAPQKKNPGVNDKTIVENLELEFYDALPTVWEETKVLEGEIGEYATIIRKTGDNWFLGSLTAKRPRSLNLKLDFLDKDKKYEATIYFQDAEGLKNNKVHIEKINVNYKSILSKIVNKNSGLAIVIKSI